MFKKGDLFKFNQQGLDLFRYITGSIGVIASDGKKMYEYDFHTQPEKREYLACDILVCGQLYRNIPIEFLERITQDEKNIERVERILKRK